MGLPKLGHLYRLTRAPELTWSSNQVAICKVGLACSEKYNDKETQFFIDVTAFKKTAEVLNTVQKGHRIFAYLKFQTESWKDQNSGQNRSKIVAIMDNFEFIEPKQPTQSSQQNQQPNQGGFNSGQGFQNNSGFQNSNDHQQPHQGPPDDHIPFACNIV